MTLGELLKEGRKEKGLTAQEAADRIKVSKMTYIRLETDQTRLISFDNIINITNNLEIDFFKIIQSLGKIIINLDLITASKVARRIRYKNNTLNSTKLEKLIEENMKDLLDD